MRKLRRRVDIDGQREYTIAGYLSAFGHTFRRTVNGIGLPAERLVVEDLDAESLGDL
jgi:hypothetical protein